MGVLKAILVTALFGCAVFGSGVVQAQDDKTLADIRQELELVYGDVLSLRRELSTTGASGMKAASGGTALQRLDTLEAELRRMTGEMEQKQNWIESIVADGTNRVGDLEFRICELEKNCDVTKLDKTAPLGGKTPSRQATIATTPSPQTSGVATGTSGSTDTERSTFARAMAAFERQEFDSAASQFATLIDNFPGGPLTGEAHYWRGAALAGSGNWNEAARSFLESFSGSPQGTKAPDALYRLGISLRELGQTKEACLMLSEVPVRYPSATINAEATAEYHALGCS